MRTRLLAFSFLFLLFTGVLQGQDLKDMARKERERQAALKQKSRVFTNEDVATQRPAEENKKPSEVAPPASAKGDEKILDLEGHDERYWSEKFLAAKKRIAAAEQEQVNLQTRLREYNYKLQTRSDVYDREHLYIPMIEEAKQNLENNRKELDAAREALNDLDVARRKSGAPAAWADSQLADQPPPAPEKPDLDYFAQQLKKIDEQYEEMMRPSKTERFRLVYRRSPQKSDKLDMGAQNYGPGLDPDIAILDKKIQELEEKHQEARSEVIRQARRAGFNIQ